MNHGIAVLCMNSRISDIIDEKLLKRYGIGVFDLSDKKQIIYK